MNSLAFSPRPAEGLPFANAAQLFADRVARNPQGAALRHKQRGAWHTLSWSDLDQASRDVAAGLVGWTGIKRGQRVAILAGNSLGWIVADVALARLGVVSVPIEPHCRGDDLAAALRHSDCQAAFAGTAVEFHRLQALIDDGSAGVLSKLVVIEPGDLDFAGLDHAITWSQLAERGAEHRLECDEVLEQRRTDLVAEDLFTIVHTPKTSSGVSKGVALTHRNIVYETWALRNVIAVDRSDEQLLMLPLYHAFGRHLVWAAFASGAVTAVMDGSATLIDNLRDVAPTFVASAPVVYEGIRRRILREVAEAGRVRAKTFAWCLDIGRQASQLRQRGELVPSWLAVKLAAADRLVFADIRRTFGGRLRFLVSGAAPARQEVLEFFHAAGLLILEGYGLTETSGAVSVNRPDRYRLGTVGPALPGCEILIADDGEVLVRGHNVMRGYVTPGVAAVVDDRGWLHTGDVGAVEHGFLRVIGRKSEAITLADGQRVHPEPLEQALGEYPDIHFALVCGEGRPRLGALLTLDRSAVLALARREGLEKLTYSQLVQHPRIRKNVQVWIDQLNQRVADEQQISTFAILPRDFGAATGELTSTLRPRRRVIYERWADTIAAMYAGSIAGSRTTAKMRP